MFFGPIVDGTFLPESPYVMMTKKSWNAVPYIIGMNNTEGCGLLTMEQPVGFKDGITKSACKDYVKGMMYVQVDVSDWISYYYQRYDFRFLIKLFFSFPLYVCICFLLFLFSILFMKSNRTVKYHERADPTFVLMYSFCVTNHIF